MLMVFCFGYTIIFFFRRTLTKMQKITWKTHWTRQDIEWKGAHFYFTRDLLLCWIEHSLMYDDEPKHSKLISFRIFEILIFYGCCLSSSQTSLQLILILVRKMKEKPYFFFVLCEKNTHKFEPTLSKKTA